MDLHSVIHPLPCGKQIAGYDGLFSAGQQLVDKYSGSAPAWLAEQAAGLHGDRTCPAQVALSRQLPNLLQVLVPEKIHGRFKIKGESRQLKVDSRRPGTDARSVKQSAKKVTKNGAPALTTPEPRIDFRFDVVTGC
jgi:hypothetical protein